MNVGVSSQEEVVEEWNLLTSRTRSALSMTRDRLKSNEAEEEQARGHSGAQNFEVFATSGSRWPGAASLHAFSTETAAAIDALRSAEAKAISLRADEAEASRRGASVLAASLAAHQRRSADSIAELNRRRQDFEREKAFCANQPTRTGAPEHVPLAIFTKNSNVVKNIFKPPLDTVMPELLGTKPVNERANKAMDSHTNAPVTPKPTPKVPEANAAPVDRNVVPATSTNPEADHPGLNQAKTAPSAVTMLNRVGAPMAPAPKAPVVVSMPTSKAPAPEAPVVASKPTSKRVTTTLPQESQSADAVPEIKPDLSKSPSLNSYLFGDADGGGDSELSSLISKV